jgi:hypothetical protein
MFFNDSRADRRKRARRGLGRERIAELERSPFPPAKSYELFTPDELFNGGDRTLAFDVEDYKNYFLVSFKCEASGKVVFFENGPLGYAINGFQVEFKLWQAQLTYVLHRFLLIGFNSRTYDMPMVMLALQGVQTFKLNEISLEIIGDDLQPYEVERKYFIKIPDINHVDLIEVAPIQASLKIYAGRLHCERMQDLPFDIHSELEPWQSIIVRDYNINDLDNTLLLYRHIKPQIDLREVIGLECQQDLRSKSDAQIAEAVIEFELNKLGVNGKKPTIEPGWQFYYKVPTFLEFKTPQFQYALDVIARTPITVGNGGNPECPHDIEALRPRLGLGTYRLGMGGLHSSEESVAYVASDDVLIIDRDVASYYPYIILNLGLYPEHLGPQFLEVYRALVDRRLYAKRMAKECKKKGDIAGEAFWLTQADGLKISINGIFGKLGNKYSKVYAPDLMAQVTITGQLCLMMLIEMVELANIPVISANTDGIVMKCPAERYADLEAVIMIWEEKTGFLTEETRYSGLYSRDVNNYIAVKIDGECKTKGVFSDKGSAQNSPLSKNPEGHIRSLAVQAFLSKGVPVEETIRTCRDVKQFVSVRTVKGGAEKDGMFLGKAIRWYYAEGETGDISYVLSGNKVPKSEGARPLMTLPSGLPPDIDFDRYINQANEILYEIGYYQPRQTAMLF